MVVLTGFEAYIVHLNLTNNVSTNVATTSVTLERPPSCYTGVEAFDIESDGSVGSLAVPGQLGGRLETPCALVQTSPSKIRDNKINVNTELMYFLVKPKATEQLSILIVIITIAVVVAVVIMLIAIIILVCKCKR